MDFIVRYFKNLGYLTILPNIQETNNELEYIGKKYLTMNKYFKNLE